MTPQHTQGPWTIGHHYEGGDMIGVIDADAFPVAAAVQKWRGGDGLLYTHPEAETNARLIAAAPEMLALLSFIKGLAGSNAFGPVDHEDGIAKLVHDNCETLIARIEGKE